MNEVQPSSYHHLLISSASRDSLSYVNDSDYKLFIEGSNFRNVTSIVLESAKIPVSQHEVDTSNNILDLFIGGNIADEYQIQLPSGNFSPTEFAARLQTLLNTGNNGGAYGGGVDPWTVTNNANGGGTQTFTVTNGTNDFNFLFATGQSNSLNRNCNAVLGFRNEDYSSALVSGVNVLSSVYTYNFSGPSSWCLDLKFGNASLGSVYTSEKNFHSLNIPIDVPRGNFVHYENKNIVPSNLRRFWDISSISVRFRDINGRDYNFNGIPHEFLFRLYYC